MKVLDKLTSIKGGNGESLLQYICTKLTEENKEFPNKMKELKDQFSTKKTDIEITKQKSGELRGMVSDATAAQKLLESFHEPNDNFQSKLKKYIEKEAMEMDNIDSDTK